MKRVKKEIWGMMGIVETGEDQKDTQDVRDGIDSRACHAAGS